ncbi:hypothetical protein BS329_41495 [Amycolatopsis coloradensis]|uniref:Peptidase inhibitor family I36 n=1 Tax=Amycolatopsis coloradensis TaxID=76021 RepID=A0A1R0KD59_9PSEU|nr:hypothetical protein [Amycolatopsis coloradensis]OLZ42825.1 hypothetical protein BS329_41495 [Amycolatopsis coloradensis]
MDKVPVLVSFAAAVAGSLLAAPANATPPCPLGWACVQLGSTGTGPVMQTQNENWTNVQNSLGVTGFSLVNNQVPGDDACVADGPLGTGRTFCLYPGETGTSPSDFVVRSAHG